MQIKKNSYRRGKTKKDRESEWMSEWGIPVQM